MTRKKKVYSRDSRMFSRVSVFELHVKHQLSAWTNTESKMMNMLKTPYTSLKIECSRFKVLMRCRSSQATLRNVL